MEDQELRTEMENLRLAAQRFEQLFQGLPIACFGFDLSGTIYEWNKACERILEFPEGSLFMNSIFKVLCSEDEQVERLGEMLDGVAKGESFESFAWSVSGRQTQDLLCSILPKPGPDGSVVGAILAALDMTAQKAYERQIESQLVQIHAYSAEVEERRTELESANRQLESLAMTDGLTGLMNHRTFYDHLNAALNTASARAPISLILLDVDDFKSFNDTFGHPEGDTVLRQVAGALQNGSRQTDCIARYGGEEFVALIRQADEHKALVVAERMRSAVESSQWPLRQVTASFGTATVWNPDISPEAFVNQADQALYVSKRTGKNRVTAFGRSMQDAA